MKLAWLAHISPDVLFEVSQLTQIQTDRFKEDSKEIIKRANRVLKYAKDNIVSVKFPSLDVETIQLVGFSDASFAGNHDHTSQLGNIVFIADKTGSAIPIHFKS